MGLNPALVPPPAVSTDTAGPVGASVAEALLAHLGPPQPGAAPGGARPAFVLVEPGSHAVADLPQRLAAATAVRGQRIWVVVTEPAQVVAADEAIEASAGVDALVLIDGLHPTTAGAALAAWTWLRHDAPSLALGTLRDSSGRACRVATITAQSPAEPPARVSTAPGTTGDRALQVLQAGVLQARATGANAAEELLAAYADPAPVMAELAQQVTTRVRPISEPLMAEASSWGPSELAYLGRTADDLARNAASDDAGLAAAAMSLGQAQAAVSHENNRSGLGSMFGRRKRIAAAESVRAQAQEAWRATVIAQGQEYAQRAFAADIAQSAPALALASEERWQQAAAEREAEALRRWLDRSVAACRRLVPPSPPGGVGVARSWGNAQPEIRRHLLVPADAALALALDDTEAVTVHAADGLSRPLALAWLMGLSAGSFPTDGQ